MGRLALAYVTLNKCPCLRQDGRQGLAPKIVLWHPYVHTHTHREIETERGTERFCFGREDLINLFGREKKNIENEAQEGKLKLCIVR